MELRQRARIGIVQAFEPVRCLSCGTAYSKPAGRGTTIANPGCPDCGYLGWLPLSQEERSSLRRFVADRPPRRLA